MITGGKKSSRLSVVGWMGPAEALDGLGGTQEGDETVGINTEGLSDLVSSASQLSVRGRMQRHSSFKACSEQASAADACRSGKALRHVATREARKGAGLRATLLAVRASATWLMSELITHPLQPLEHSVLGLFDRLLDVGTIGVKPQRNCVGSGGAFSCEQERSTRLLLRW